MVKINNINSNNSYLYQKKLDTWWYNYVPLPPIVAHSITNYQILNNILNDNCYITLRGMLILD
jgi:nitrate reductase cytochrome c-type subunit